MATSEEIKEAALRQYGVWLDANMHHVVALLKEQRDRCRDLAAERSDEPELAQGLLGNAEQWDQLATELEALPPTFDPWNVES